MDYLVHYEDGSDGYLSHHGVKGMKWGVRNAETIARYSRQAKRSVSTQVDANSFNKINSMFKSMPLSDRKLIDPDSTDKPKNYFKSLDDYRRTVAYNIVSDDGFLVAEKIPKNKNVDGTKGVEIGIGVKNKGQGVGTEMTGKLVKWFNHQNTIDVMWWPVDEHNYASKRIAEKNGFIKDPLGNNYLYATKPSTLKNLGIK